jgi:hypothetical protein
MGRAPKQAEEGGEEYGGPRPFSEPETRIVRLIGQATRPQAFVNLHSGEYAVYVPWDSQAGLAPGLPADIGEVLEKLDAYCQCMHGPAGEVAGCAYTPVNSWTYCARALMTVSQRYRRLGFVYPAVAQELQPGECCPGCMQVPGVRQQHGLHVPGVARGLPPHHRGRALVQEIQHAISLFCMICPGLC